MENIETVKNINILKTLSNALKCTPYTTSINIFVVNRKQYITDQTIYLNQIFVFISQLNAMTPEK